VSSRNDIWALGLLLVETLIGKPPQSGDGVIHVPDDLPEPFRSIAQACLQCDPAKRCSIAEIRRMLESPVQATKPRLPAQVLPTLSESKHDAMLQKSETVVETSPAKQKITLPNTEAANTDVVEKAHLSFARDEANAAAPAVDTIDPDAPQTAELKFLLDKEPLIPTKTPKRFAPLAVAIFIGLIALVALIPFFGRHSEEAQPQGQAPQQTDAGKAGSLPRQSPAANAAIVRPTSGAVAQQVMPDVSRAAQNSIHGAVKVRVRVNANEMGDVVLAGLATHGPSQYFARQALEAARQWKFAPPSVDGTPVASRWLIEFEFRRGGVKAEPRMISSRG
jgi:TonB family protein